MRRDAIDSSAVWREDRDDVFLARFAADCAMLLDAGVPPDVVRKVVCRHDYVRVWAATPHWMFPVKKLPKGYKWKDGEVFKQKGSAKREAISRTIYFLEIGDNLYFRDTSKKGFVGLKEGDCQGWMIRNWPVIPAGEVLEAFTLDNPIYDVLAKFYRSKGYRCLTRPLLRDAETGWKSPEIKPVLWSERPEADRRYALRQYAKWGINPPPLNKLLYTEYINFGTLEGRENVIQETRENMNMARVLRGVEPVEWEP